MWRIVKRKWTEEQINNPPSKWTGKYTAIKAECKEHQISQSGDLKTCLNRLRTHYKEPHQTATRRARTLTMTDFWKPKGTPALNDYYRLARCRLMGGMRTNGRHVGNVADNMPSDCLGSWIKCKRTDNIYAMQHCST